jgi:hypothetical protein
MRITGVLKNRIWLFPKKLRDHALEWSATGIVARAEPGAADIDLRISFVDQHIERTSRETAARGATGVDTSHVEHWVLGERLP